MIPEDVRDFAMAPLTFAWLATRDGNNVPRTRRSWVWNLEGNRVTVHVGDTYAAALREDLEDNGRVAMGWASPDARAYQVKGQCVEVRDATEADRRYFESCKEERIAAFVGAGYPEAIVRPWIDSASTVIVFEAETVFDQRPGPKAGSVLGAAHAS